MNQIEKEQIVKDLNDRMNNRSISQNKVASMIGISPATISQVFSGKWKENAQLISEEMWNKIGSWLSVSPDWVLVQSDPTFKKIINICNQSQKRSQSRAIVGVPGTGKSNALKHYSRENHNVFYLECSEYWTRKVFLNKLKKAMGLTLEESSVHDMVESILDKLRVIRMPLVIMDEADKLKDPVLSFFNCFYNETFERCGFVMAGAPYLEQRIVKGVRLNKQSYRELFSRVGGEFKKVEPAREDSIVAICEANGITKRQEQQRVLNKCASGDLRAVKNEITNLKIRNEN